ncbi:DUF4185 domain-containing protein [Saccharicrinis sp. FJH54]|uniref:DUF4185 domain-containing protein n=1 Tax=Saccharicrinis sp. FJH54 TaxID=3344665 RepID=UPI0035D40241
MKWIAIFIFMLPLTVLAQSVNIKVDTLDNSLFKHDSYWRGADGAASVPLNSGKVLWLFSDTFIDKKGKGKRSASPKMIRNSIAIQDSNTLESKMTFYYNGKGKNADDFFQLPGDNWFWTGHGIMIKDKLVVFLMEETATHTGIGFEAIGWYLAIINNPEETPDKWIINYYKGPDTFGVIIGSSAVLKDDAFVYVFGVKEPATHETYLLRIAADNLVNGNLKNLEWWVNSIWTSNITTAPISSSLFTGQTEFSVHFDQNINKFVQVQTYGMGQASIGYRLADKLYGPWSKPVLFYTPALKNNSDFVYTANAHPEFLTDGLIVTYNINSGDLNRLIHHEEIYFPKIINIKPGTIY